VAALPQAEAWDSLSRAALRYGLYDALTALTDEMVSGAPPGQPPVERVKRWEQANFAAIA